MKNPFRYFKTSPEIIRLAVMMYVRFPLSLRQVEKLLHELMRKAMQRYGRPEVVVTDRHRCC
jgi:transposase-like protein